MPTEHPHEPKCETCRYWHQYDRRRNFGECFRYPPRSMWGSDYSNNEVEHSRPKTCKWDWCGEHAEPSHAPEATAGEHENPQQGEIQSRTHLKDRADGQHSEKANTGFFAKLTPEQQAAALAYDGPEG